MDMTQYFGQHSLAEKASEFSDYPKGKDCTKSGLWHKRTQPQSTNQFLVLGLF